MTDPNLTTWRRQLTIEMTQEKDPGPILALAPDDRSFDVEFDPSYGLTEGPPVLAWTERNVYFPATYDGSEWMASAPRNPQATGRTHVGG
jgi:hypothetical protein